ncbi:MAG: hypothetical protein Q4F84_01880 [Fibrobacter sp.]|nr:hypothetical protein [Fibrobacter sp.]
MKMLILIISLCAVASFGQQSDTVSKSDSKKTEMSVSEQKDSNKEDKALRKALIVNKSPTTWTKIKDLFM